MTRRVMPVVLGGLLAACSGDGGSAAEPEGISLRQAVMIEPASTDVAAVYLTIRNPTPSPDTILAVESPMAVTSEIHDQVRDGGMVRMEHRHRLVVPARTDVVLAPGGLHVMLKELTGPIVLGDTISVRFRFARSGEIVATVPVMTVADLP